MQCVPIGEPVSIALHAVAAADTQLFRALDMVFTWEPEFLGLVGLDNTGAVPLLSSGFPLTGDHGLNEGDPPWDGDGCYRS